MADRSKQSFRFKFNGMHTRSSADAIPQNKYPLAVNARSIGESDITTRPGYAHAFDTGAIRATDMRSYTALGTDSKPRIVVHDSSGRVYLDDGTYRGRVGTGGPGASMIPYRPNQSPESWMYIANPTGYRKLSVPDSSSATSIFNVGIAEPQSAPEACPDGLAFTDFTGTYLDWTATGTANANPINTLISLVGYKLLQDPASVSPAIKTRYSVIRAGYDSIGFSSSPGEVVRFNKVSGGYVASVTEDIYPAISQASGITIAAIQYDNQSAMTGKCVIVPTMIPVLTNTNRYDANGNPIYAQVDQLAMLRRGSVIQLNASEDVFVLSATTGSDGSISIEASTTATHFAGESITGRGAASCSGMSVPITYTADSNGIEDAITTGIGYLTQTLFTNPFLVPLGPTSIPQDADFIHISFYLDDPTKVKEIRLIFDIGDGGFAHDYLYYSITTFEPGGNQWIQVKFPISDLVRVGNSPSLTIQNANKVRISVECTANVTLRFASLWVGGGGQPDAGDPVSPYYYRVRPRSNVTGVIGNPSPGTRYGVIPSRQRVIVSLPSAAYDPQITTWDVFRYGGTVTTNNVAVVGSPWRYIGSADASSSVFVDNQFDDAALAGDALEFDNFEPWPSIDKAFVATAGDGKITSIVVAGTEIVLNGATFPATINRWLPGTLITLDGKNTYTLRKRPVAFHGGYVIDLVENAGSPTVTSLFINEPDIAAQITPYVWGPSSEGVFFGVGDSLRPGVLYSSKQLNIDSAPDNVYDLTPPSEPLIGGDIVDGLSIVASSNRWWAIQPAFNQATRWNLVEMPAGRGLAAPWGRCNDGKAEYFWAKDGIYMMQVLGASISLTDADLYNIFPHDRIPGSNVSYAGYTVYAPDYSQASEFRLSVANSFLKAHYLDSNGNQRTLVLDMSMDASGKPRMAWSVDVYNDQITNSYYVEQPPGSLATTGTSYKQAYMCDAAGKVYTESILSNDNGVAINCAVSTFEWDMGDVRFEKQWLDSMLDCVPASGITATLIAGGSPAAASVAVSASASRAIPPVLIAPPGPVIKNYLGLLLEWIDDFSVQSVPTKLISWSLEAVVQPLTLKTWQSVPTSHEINGYHHIRKLILAYKSLDVVTLTITAYDGVSPAVITLPNTSGAYRKVEFIPTANKGFMFTYQVSSPQPFAMIWEDCEVHVGSWERASAYEVVRDLGGKAS